MTETAMNREWYAIVWWGSGPYPMPARGPWQSYDEAADAIERWRERVDRHPGPIDWGTIEAAHSIRIVGPFRSRREARDADISTAPVASRREAEEGR